MIEWRKCADFSDCFISNTGELRRDDFYFKLSKTVDGYLKVNISGKTRLIHRLVGLAFLENLENKPEINHIDGNKKNNVVGNLEWVTRKENAKHNFSKLGHSHKGEKNSRSILTAKEVAIIRKFDPSASNKKNLAQLLGVNICTIRDIFSRKSWVYDEARRG